MSARGHHGLMLAAGGVGDYGALILAQSPVLWLKLNETSGSVAADSSGNGRNCSIQNCTYDASGILFSQNSSYVGRTDPALRIGSDNSWAVAATVTKESGGGSVMRGIAIYWHNESAGHENFRLSLSNGDVPVIKYEATDGTDVGTGDSSPVTLSQPFLLHAVRRPAGLYLYKNGILVGSTTNNNTKTAVAGDAYFRVGGNSTFPGSYGFLGKIRDVVLYDHELDAATILSHAQAAGFA